MTGPTRTGITLHIWPEGLAVVTEAATRRFAAAFGPRGWQSGDLLAVLPDGPPPDASKASLSLPSWLAEQLLSLTLSGGGLHTDFVRLPRMVERLRAEGEDGVVLVLGSTPLVATLHAGRISAVEPHHMDEASLKQALAAARGWIIFLSGNVTVPATPLEPLPAVAAEAAQSQPHAPGTSPAGPVPQQPEDAAVHAAKEGAQAEDRFIVSAAAAAGLPAGVATDLTALVGDTGLKVPVLLDGTRTAAEIAQATGLSREQVEAVIRALVARKLAFRYVSRPRRPAGSRS